MKAIWWDRIKPELRYWISLVVSVLGFALMALCLDGIHEQGINTGIVSVAVAAGLLGFMGAVELCDALRAFEHSLGLPATVGDQVQSQLLGVAAALITVLLAWVSVVACVAVLCATQFVLALTLSRRIGAVLAKRRA